MTKGAPNNETAGTFTSLNLWKFTPSVTKVIQKTLDKTEIAPGLRCARRPYSHRSDDDQLPTDRDKENYGNLKISGGSNNGMA